MALELAALVQLLRDQKVCSYLEVGARYGDTFYDVVRHLPKNARAVAVDLPASLWGSEGTEPYLRDAVGALRAEGWGDVHLILGDSRSPEVIEQVRALGPFDAALLDGDHTYDGVRHDWETYGPLADLVAFHDIVGEGQRHDADHYVEVPRLWREIRHERCSEFVAPHSAMGIGVWRK